MCVCVCVCVCVSIGHWSNWCSTPLIIIKGDKKQSEKWGQGVEKSKANEKEDSKPRHPNLSSTLIALWRSVANLRDCSQAQRLRMWGGDHNILLKHHLFPEPRTNRDPSHFQSN